MCLTVGGMSCDLCQSHPFTIYEYLCVKLFAEKFQKYPIRVLVLKLTFCLLLTRFKYE